MNIIIAGAGHGGLVAGAKFAAAGHSVTVFEKKKREALGHDWEDRFTFNILLDVTGSTSLPENSWRYRGDCAFVSPSYRTKVIINYNDETRQKIMWRKAVIDMLISHAEKCNVNFVYETDVISPIVENDRVIGINTSRGEFFADLIIDSAGAFSPLRTKLPESFAIENNPSRGDVFYAYRAYYRKNNLKSDDIPFEVYLAHDGEQGLSWCCTNSDSVDILIGRIDKLQKDKLDMHIESFKKTHPWTDDEILHGGSYGIIPVRRPLTLMVAEGYAAVGDSAYMTTPMNGMGIDLSLLAGKLLAETVLENNNDTSVKTLWKYNRDFHRLYGGDTAKNEGLKNSLLQLPKEGVDFLFDNAVIQASDLAGAGKNMNFGILLGKFFRGMKNPSYFFAIINGLIKGSKAAKAYKNAPEEFDRSAIEKWQKTVEKNSIKVTRRS